VPHTIAIDARKLEDFGIGTYVRNLVSWLGKLDRDNQYLLLTHDTERDFFGDLPDNFEAVYERCPVYSLRELLALSWKLFRLDVDLYHSTHYVLPLLVPSKVVVTIHDLIHLLYPEFLPSRLAFFYAQRMIRHSLGRSDRIITVSRSTKTDLKRHFDVDSGKIRVVHNGVDDRYRQELPSAEIQRWLQNFGIRQPYLLFVGNPTKPHKNLDRVLQAYAKAAREGKLDAPLVCVGDRGSAAFKLRQRAEQLGIDEQVQLLGHVAEEALPALYQGASLLLYPTLYEGFGLPVIEAMASGVAVITANGSALKEIAEGYAHLVDPLDVDAIADAIGYCMTDTEHREALAKLGRRRSEDFHWKRTAEKTLEIYRSVLASKEPAKKAAGAPATPEKPKKPPADDGGEAPSAASQAPERALAEEP